MKIILATGIFPPEIGGPATYVLNLARELTGKGFSVTVITYGKTAGIETLYGDTRVIRVGMEGGSILRWQRYARALRQHGAHADIVYGFSSVSCGVPLAWARLKQPRKVLRLGGDFLWERYTDKGGELGLRKWYEEGARLQGAMNGLLKTFDHIVFSTEFQEQLYERFYERLPLHSVIENALPASQPLLHPVHTPLRLLFLGRFVGFKNLDSLLEALKDLPGMHLSLIGSGPLEKHLRERTQELGLSERVTFGAPVHGEEKTRVFQEHDLLVLPSHTEISPNAALEARAAGLPVLLTEETGLSRQLTEGIAIRTLRTPRDIVQAITDIADHYSLFAEKASSPLPERGWAQVCDEHIALFRSLL
jgi:glycosyltransferase involved in cell wall biosynthesis